MLDSAMTTWLQERFGEAVRFNEPMGRHTSLGVGGPAEAWTTVPCLADLAALVRRCHQGRVPWLVVGDGTNLLVRDGGIAGVVAVLGGEMRQIRMEPAEAKGTVLAAGAGARLSALCRMAIDKGLAGLNFALGIPGTVGGAVRMNAGTEAGWLSDVLTQITVLTAAGETRQIPKTALAAGYRHLDWEGASDQVVVEARIVLAPGDRGALASEAADRLRRRRIRQPVRHPSAGCVFKNPPAGPGAGELIDRAGLRGHRLGDAQISEGHANFIVNRGRARAAEILELMALARKEVVRRFGVELEAEVRIVGTP